MARYLADALFAGQQALVVGLVGLAAVLLVVLVDPRAGLWLWIALGPFSVLINLSMGRGIPDLGLHRVVSLSLVALLIAQVAIGRRRLLRPTAIEWAALAYGLALLISVPASRSGLVWATQSVYDLVITPVLVLVIARNLQAGHRDIRGALMALAVVATTLGLATIREQLTHQTFLAPHPFTWEYAVGIIKVSSIFGHPAIMATTLTVVIPAIFYGFSQARDLSRRLLWGSSLAVALLGLFMTYVRAGWLAVTVSLALMLLLSRRARRYFVPFLILAAVMVVLYGSRLSSEGIIAERLNSQAPITYRLDAWKVGWQIFRRSPLIGLGFDSFAQAAINEGFTPQISSNPLPVILPHNLYVYIAVSAGLLALLPFISIFALVLWRARQLWRQQIGPMPVDRDLLAVLISTVVGYVLIIGTYDAMGAQLGSLLLFFIIGTILGVHEPDPAKVTV